MCLTLLLLVVGCTREPDDQAAPLEVNIQVSGAVHLDGITEDTSYAVQQGEFDALAEAAPRCAGDRLDGFRAKRFTADDDTYALLDTYGYLERSARSELWDVFTGVLDTLEAEGAEIEFVTAEVLVQRHAGCSC